MGYRKDFENLDKEISKLESELKQMSKREIPFSREYFTLINTIGLLRNMQSVLDNSILMSDNPYQE